MTNKNKKDKFIDGLLVVYATYLTKISRDIILPAMPLLAEQFSTSSSYTRAAITAYFIGIACSRFIWSFAADISDKRRLLISLHIAFIACSFICLATNYYSFIILGRFFQAFTIASIPIVMRSLLHDKHGTKKTIKIYAYLGAISAWSPAIATTLGAIIIAYCPWQTIFYVLVLAALLNLLLITSFFTDNSTPAKMHQVRILHSYHQIFTMRDFWLLAIPFSLIIGCNAAYLTIAPFQLMVHSDVSNTEFGLSFFILMTGSVIGRVMAGKLIDYVSVVNLLRFASLLGCLISGVGLMLVYFIPSYTYTLLFIMACFYMVIGLTAPVSKTFVSCLQENLKTTLLGALTVFESTISALIAILAAYLAASWLNLYLMLFINSCLATFLLIFLQATKYESC